MSATWRPTSSGERESVLRRGDCVRSRACDHWKRGARRKNLGGPFEQLILPGRYLVGMDVKLLGQLHQRAVALDRRDCHLRLKGRCMVPARLSPDSRANLARCQAEAPLIALCRFPKPALSACDARNALLGSLRRWRRSCGDPVSNGECRRRPRYGNRRRNWSNQARKDR